MRKKEILIILGIGFLYGVFFGIYQLESVNSSTLLLELMLYVMIFVFVLLYVNIKYKRTARNMLFFPLFSFVMYLPVNVLAGMYFKDGDIRYYSSYPRYDVAFIYISVLLGLYFILYVLNKLLDERYDNKTVAITDVLSLFALPILLIATYFVSPH